jgi:Translation machinery associated TMA7
MRLPLRQSRPQVNISRPNSAHILTDFPSDAKARKELAEKAKGKGPLNAGQQGIKKSGKK